MKNKGLYCYFTIFLLIFVGYNDFWNWGKYEPLYGGWLPAWVLWHIFLMCCCALTNIFLGKSLQSHIEKRYRM